MNNIPWLMEDINKIPSSNKKTTKYLIIIDDKDLKKNKL